MSGPATKPVTVVCAVERMASCCDDMQPLFEQHREEVTKHKELMWLNPDLDAYRRADAENRMVIITVRHSERLIGYFIWMLARSLHYKHVLCAHEDIHYLLPEYRHGMTGYRMMRYALDVLRPLKVQYVLAREKVGHEHPALMQRLGFEPLDIIYAQKLET